MKWLAALLELLNNFGRFWERLQENRARLNQQKERNAIEMEPADWMDRHFAAPELHNTDVPARPPTPDPPDPQG